VAKSVLFLQRKLLKNKIKPAWSGSDNNIISKKRQAFFLVTLKVPLLEFRNCNNNNALLNTELEIQRCIFGI
jgi:hypothetical protein